MSQVSTVSLTITPDAAAQVNGLAMQEALEQMLERARQIIPGLHSLTVSLQQRYDEPESLPAINIEAISDNPSVDHTPVEREWAQWEITTFPPEVCEHFTLFAYYVPNHAR